MANAHRQPEIVSNNVQPVNVQSKFKIDQPEGLDLVREILFGRIQKQLESNLEQLSSHTSLEFDQLKSECRARIDQLKAQLDFEIKALSASILEEKEGRNKNAQSIVNMIQDRNKDVLVNLSNTEQRILKKLASEIESLQLQKLDKDHLSKQFRSMSDSLHGKGVIGESAPFTKKDE